MNSYNTWWKYVNEGIVSDEIEPLIKESWQIAKHHNVSINQYHNNDCLDGESMQYQKKLHKLRTKFINKYICNIAKGISNDCSFAIFLANQEGYILRRLTSLNMSTRKDLGILVGQNWSIKNFGTTAIGISMKNDIPVWVKSYEHYQERFHGYTSIGVPIHDSEGNLIYVLGLLVKEERLLRIIYALMLTAVQGIEREIFHLEYHKKIEELNRVLDKQKNMYEVQSNLLNHIFDNVSDMIITMDDKRSLIKLNKEAEGFLKRNQVKSIDEMYSNLKITDKDNNIMSMEEDPIYGVFQGNTARSFQLGIESDNGICQQFLLDAVPYYDVEGNKLTIGILKNISDYKKTHEIKEMYKKKAEELENIINTITDGVAIVNAAGVYTLINPACDEIFEYSRHLDKHEFVAGMTMKYGTVSKLDGTPIQAEEYPVYRVLNGVTLKNELHKIEANNKIKYITFSGKPVFNETGQLEYSVLSFSDVTKIQKQKNKILQQVEFIKNIMDGMGAPVAVFKYPSLELELINEVFFKLLKELVGQEQENENIIGKTIHDIMPEKYVKGIEKLVNIAAKSNFKGEAETLSFKSIDGDMKHLHIICTPFSNENEGTSRVTIVGIDVTNEIQAKKSVEAMSKVKEEYFTILSHELRSPIAVIHFAIQMLLSEYYIDEFKSGTLKMLKKIEKNSLRLLRLVNNFLDISRVEAGYMSVSNNNINIVNLTEALLESIIPIAVKKNINIKFSHSCHRKVVAIDIEKYERIFLNLVSNAFKFTEAGGQVDILISENKEELIISIKDNGIGIPIDKQDKIFNRFFIVDGSLTRRSEGTGIGLSLVKKLLDLMGGQIKVVSEVGVGSEFTLYIPKTLMADLEEVQYTEAGDNMAEKIYMEFADIS